MQRGTRPRALVSALGLTVGGSIACFVLFLTLRPLITGLFGEPLSDVAYVFRNRTIQWAFGLFAGGYLLATRSWAEYARFRRPTLRDASWTLIGLVGIRAMTRFEKLVLSAVGLSLDPLSNPVPRDVGLGSWPLLWPAVFVALYLVPAILEEQFYRGLVQTRLREAYSPAGEVALGAGCFALSHQVWVLGAGPELMATYAFHIFAQGLVFALVYQRTDNLLTAAAVHSLTWAGAYGALTGLLGLP
ncbi:CPBP family intramembrane glutamic endopeptidase [Halorussus sp. AFM4]|uniref:CPBP family intramembrane glutamic endopeptidase n=1 Tax=Halorussus sp. AFM4 TaxID=3421651 RepID=UPI003EBBF000